MSLLNTRTVIVSVTGGGGGLSGSTAYSDPIDCSKAAAIKVRAAYTKAGINVTLGLVDASSSANATISGTYDPILSTIQSTAAQAPTHTLSATGRALLVANLGGACDSVRLAYTGSGGGASGDVLIAEMTIVELS